jgi:hypothetical protein
MKRLTKKQKEEIETKINFANFWLGYIRKELKRDPSKLETEEKSKNEKFQYYYFNIGGFKMILNKKELELIQEGM